MAKIKCFECGCDVDAGWFKRTGLTVPLCPDCYDEFRHLFEQVPDPLEFKERCNLE